MAQKSELITRIEADNSQFKAVMRESTSEAQKFSKGLTSSLGQAAKLLATGLIGGQAIRYLKEGYESVDRLSASAEKLGISAESFQFLEYAAKQSDVEIGSLESSLRRLNLSVAKGLGGNANIAGAFSELGISLQEIKSLNVDQVFERVSTSLSQLTRPNQVRLGTLLFGKNFQDLITLTSKNLKTVKQDFADIGGAANIQGFDNIDDSVNKLTTRLETLQKRLFITFGGPGLSVLNSFLDGINKISNGISRGATGINDLINRGQYGVPQSRIIGNLPNIDPLKGFETLSTAINNLVKIVSPNSLTSVNTKSAGASAANTASQSLIQLADASGVAAGALRELKQLDLKAALGLSPQGGQAYLDSILTPLTQVKDDYFTKLATNLQSNLAEGGNGFGRSNNETLLNELRARSQEILPGTGESKSGMENAVRLLEQQFAKIPKPKDQQVTIKLEYDEDGIIKAFVSSADAKVAMANTIAAYTALEAHSTVASGG